MKMLNGNGRSCDSMRTTPCLHLGEKRFIRSAERCDLLHLGTSTFATNNSMDVSSTMFCSSRALFLNFFSVWGLGARRLTIRHQEKRMRPVVTEGLFVCLRPSKRSHVYKSKSPFRVLVKTIRPLG